MKDKPMNKRFYGALLFRASLVAFVAHFLILPSAYANLNTSVPPTWMIDGDTPNPYPISIGTEPATPLNQVSTLTMGARAAASASSETVDVDGTLSSPMIAVSAIGTSG
ncbi:MAG: hypothetical protein LUG50_10825 [Planctomycetaceae bacterium]|nr:hypothetical protein [Planctomycetaceae bacterium]